MNFTVETQKLQDMVTRVIKCSTNNKLIPLTSLLSVKVENGVLTLCTTDATNYYKVKYPSNVECEDFEVSVIADTFAKLVQKTTTEKITLQLENNILTVTGNGKYHLELPLDENGNVIKFPSVFKEVEPKYTIKQAAISSILNYNKPSLAVSVELPALTCYYCGNSVLTSDSYKVCSTDFKLFEKPMLISATLMELLGTINGETIGVTHEDNHTFFSTDTDVIYAPDTEGVLTYPATAINEYISGEFPSWCKVPREKVLELLDRLALFISSYDKRAIYLTFTNEGVLFSSKTSSGTELIPYTNSGNFKEFTCAIDIEMLKSQVATQHGDLIELHYGLDMAVKMISDGVVQIVALAEDDRIKE